MQRFKGPTATAQDFSWNLWLPLPGGHTWGLTPQASSVPIYVHRRLCSEWPCSCLSDLSSIHIEILLGRPSTPGAISLPPPHWGIIQFDSIMAECVLLARPPELEAGAEAEPVPVHGELRLMVHICLVPELQGGKLLWNGITQISTLRTLLPVQPFCLFCRVWELKYFIKLWP